MTNHNGIWYESGRTARYGGECNGDLATTLERCFRSIKLTKRLQLSYNDGCLDLKPGDDDTSEPCIEQNENNNWTDLAPKVQLIEIVQLDMSRCGLDGAFSSTRTERHCILVTLSNLCRRTTQGAWQPSQLAGASARWESVDR